MYNPSNFWGSLHSREGRLDASFFLVVSGLSGEFSPLERGLRGVLR